MKNKIKKILIKLYIVKHLKVVKEKYLKYIRDYNNKKNKLQFFNFLLKTKVVDISKNKEILYDFLKNVKYKKIQEKGFIYYLDMYKTIYCQKIIYGNLSIDYNKVLDNPLCNIFKDENGNITDRNRMCLNSLEKNIDNCITAIENSNREDKEKFIFYFNNIKTSKVSSFEEGLQRILWYNQILWQTGHTLMGLGRLDKILNHLYEQDIKKNNLTKETAKNLIKNFIQVLHENYWYKSNSLMGDTGQIIILGGLEYDGKYFCNELTYLFIECVKEMQLPEPKTLLRVSNNMPDDLLQLSLESIKTGIGCPLFSNDEIVINKLIEFGIESQDAYNYITSACWEPIIPGKSVAQNNICSIIYMEPFNELLENENLYKFKNIEQIISCYYGYLEKHIDQIIKNYENMKFNKDELLSALTEKCNNKKLDITEGGAKYNHVGFTTVSMANLVESLINIKTLVYEDKKFSLVELNEMRKNNYMHNEDVCKMLKDSNDKYGDNSLQVIELTNKISDMANEIIMKYKTKFNGKYKIGLSSPSYISDASGCFASFDGRKDYEPFNVHISSSHGNYIELIQFASQLNYSQNRINGNVVDFIVSPTILNDNMDKFKSFLKQSIKKGFYQMQMNVISSETLMKAKNNPDLFPNLIVRVWGFSAYFNDLPEEYKNLIIERTLKTENMN